MKEILDKYYNKIFYILLAFLLCLSFLLGREVERTNLQNPSLSIESPQVVFGVQKSTFTVPETERTVGFVGNVSSENNAVSNLKQGAYVGSKNGTKYYTPGCSATKRIKPENYIWFQTVEDATLQGYSKGSC